jgi:hypothetical protein
MTEEQISTKKEFWQKWFTVSSFMFPACHLLALFFIQSALPFFIVLGVTLGINVFVAVKYYRVTTAYWTLLATKAEAERRAALFTRLES